MAVPPTPEGPQPETEEQRKARERREERARSAAEAQDRAAAFNRRRARRRARERRHQRGLKVRDVFLSVLGVLVFLLILITLISIANEEPYEPRENTHTSESAKKPKRKSAKPTPAWMDKRTVFVAALEALKNEQKVRDIDHPQVRDQVEAIKNRFRFVRATSESYVLAYTGTDTALRHGKGEITVELSGDASFIAANARRSGEHVRCEARTDRSTLANVALLVGQVHRVNVAWLGRKQDRFTTLHPQCRR